MLCGALFCIAVLLSGYTSREKGWMRMEYFNAFWVGGLICVAGQLLIDLTRLTPARIMVLFVTGGVVLGALGVYSPLVEFAGSGATVPLVGFGWALSEGVRKAVEENGLFGAFTGGLTAGAAGTAAAIFLWISGGAGGQAWG